MSPSTSYGSPPREKWKYVWGNGSAAGNSSTSSAGAGVGSAASDRLYRSAATARSARERLQRQVLEEARPTSARARSPGEARRQQALVAERFSHVLASTAAGRFQKDVVALAAVRGGAEEGDRVRDAYNYGDMLFQEGMMQQARKEEARHRELARREREELERECTFKPAVSALADQFAHRAHIGERGDELAMAQRERMQVGFGRLGPGPGGATGGARSRAAHAVSEGAHARSERRVKRSARRVGGSARRVRGSARRVRESARMVRGSARRVGAQGQRKRTHGPPPAARRAPYAARRATGADGCGAGGDGARLHVPAADLLSEEPGDDQGIRKLPRRDEDT